MRRAIAVIGLVTILLAAASCSGRDAASQQSCDTARRVLKLYDQYRTADPASRAGAAQGAATLFAKSSVGASGSVQTSIQALADATDGLNLDAMQDPSNLRQQLDRYDTRIAAARPAFESACT